MSQKAGETSKLSPAPTKFRATTILKSPTNVIVGFDGPRIEIYIWNYRGHYYAAYKNVEDTWVTTTGHTRFTDFMNVLNENNACPHLLTWFTVEPVQRSERRRTNYYGNTQQQRRQLSRYRPEAPVLINQERTIQVLKKVASKILNERLISKALDTWCTGVTPGAYSNSYYNPLTQTASSVLDILARFIPGRQSYYIQQYEPITIQNIAKALKDLHQLERRGD